MNQPFPREFNVGSHRNQCGDFVRGVLIFFACVEHFALYLNVWYVRFFDSSQIYSKWQMPNSLYEFHSDWLGKMLPADGIQAITGRALIPWLTHLYIALSGYNLARTPVAEVRSGLPDRLKKYSLLFAVFFAENLIVAPDFGIGISLFPITTLMLILMITAVIYAYFGIRGIICVFLTSAAWNIAVNLDWISGRPFELFLQHIHPWSSAAEPLAYLPGCLEGLIVGFWLFQRPRNEKQISYGIFFSLFCAGLLFFFCKEQFRINPYYIFESDELLQSSNTGLFFIYSIVCAILLLIEKGVKIEVPRFLKGLEYVGIHSLGIFFVHRIVFLKILVPVRLHIGSYFHEPLSNSSWETCFIYFPLTVAIYYLLQKNRFFGEFFTKPQVALKSRS